MNSKRYVLLGAGLILGACALGSGQAAQVTSYWVDGSSNWNISGNWSNAPALGGFPNNGNAGVATYDAVINSGTATVNQDITIQKFTFGGGGIGGSSNLICNDTITWTGGTLSGTGTTTANGGAAINASGGGLILNERVLSLMGTATLTNGSIQSVSRNNNGRIRVAAGATFDIRDDSSLFSEGGCPLGCYSALGWLDNAGLLLKSGAGNNASGQGAGVSVVSFVLNNSGTVQVNAGTLQIAQAFDWDGFGTNTGTIVVSPSATLKWAANYVLGGQCIGSGVVEFAAGTVNVNSNYNIGGGTIVDGGTANFNATVASLGPTLTISSGAANLNGSAATVSTLNLSGGSLGGSNNLTVAGGTSWTGGTMGGTGTTAAVGSLSINPNGGSLVLNGRTLQIAGAAVLTNGSIQSVSGNNNGRIRVATGATFDIRDDSSLFSEGGCPLGCYSALGWLDNAGLLVKSGAGNNASGQGAGVSVVSFVLNNSGTVQVNAGTLQIAQAFDWDGFGTNTGTIVVSPSATLKWAANYVLGGQCIGSGVVEFAAGTVNVNSNYNIGGGTIVDGGTANFNATVASLGPTLTISAGAANFNGTAATAGMLNLSGGSLGGTGNVTATGLTTWTGGTMGDAGTTTANGGALINAGGGTLILNGRVLSLMGMATLTNGSIQSVSGGNDSRIRVTAGAVFNIRDDSSVFNGYFCPLGCYSTLGWLDNAGLLVKSGAGNNASGQGTNISVIQWGLTNSGVVEVNVGTLNFAGGFTQTAGSLVLNGGAINSSSALSIQAGYLRGTGTVNAAVSNNGTISPGFPTGRLDINGNVTLQTGSRLAIELGGFTQGTGYDFVNVSSNVTLGGNLQVSFTNNFETVATNGASFTVLTASAPLAGSFANVTSGGTLFTVDGLARVTVQYSGSSVVLSGLQMIGVVNDGIPAWWRAAYFGGSGLTTNSQSCALCDPDGDGRNNLQEYLSGTDPTNSASAFRITEIAPSGSDMLLSWTAVGGKRYALQTSSGDNGNYSSNFVDLNPAIIAPGTGDTEVTVLHLGGATNSTSGFYRVRLVP